MGDLVESLAFKNNRQILLVVLDGLGGVPRNGKTELESSWMPNLNRLAANSSLGLMHPVEPGVTPGSGPAHIALFGYDPVELRVGRGVLEALGIGFDVRPGDVCFRANLATIDSAGRVRDRRAARIPTAQSAPLCERLQAKIRRIEDVEVIVRPGIEHRFVVVLRGPGLSDAICESDPLHDGEPPLEVKPADIDATRTARIANEFIRRCGEELAAEPQANYVLLRGPALLPHIPSMAERFRLNPACIAAYPMYRGLAKLVGMRILDAGDTWETELAALQRHRDEHDFFFFHIKDLDKAGENGDFERKQELLEQLDEELVTRLEALKFDVLCITGDHSTPALLGGHSWHPVPLLIHSSYCWPQGGALEFGERACGRGILGTRRSRELMTLLLAHGLKLKKFGA